MTCDFLWCRRTSMESTVEQRYAVMFCFKLGKSTSETSELIKKAYRDDALSRTRVFEWHKCLREGRELVEHRVGRPTTAQTDAQVAKVKKVLDSVRREKGAQMTSVRLQRGGSSCDDKGSQQYSGNFRRDFDEWQTRQTKCIDAGGMYFEDY